MSIFAISDLHLSKSNPKPMNIFGEKWDNHWDKIKNDWMNVVKENDTVLVPGDISWAMTIEEALLDIQDISNMPGRKIFIQGNHDYWWQSASKVRKILTHNTEIIQNDFIDIGDFLICGTRGWLMPGDERFQEKDNKIFKRELIRLEMSLSKASSISSKEIIVMIHFPPFNVKEGNYEFIDIMKKYNVKICVYGHLHGDGINNVFEGFYSNIEFYMVSCDYLDFKLKRIY